VPLVSIQDLGSLGEFVAAIATIATLIYLAIQIRQNTESVRMSAETDVSRQFADWASLVVNNPELGRIWDAAADDPDSLSDEEIRQFLWFVMELLLLYEAQYHLYRKGLISQESWDAKAHMYLGVIKMPIVSNWWDSGLGPFSEQFRTYINENRHIANPNWKYGSVAQSGKNKTGT
jgi:uncharacterized membrane protein